MQGFVVAGLAVAAACDQDFADPSLIDQGEAQVIVDRGGPQSGALGAIFPEPLRVQVRDERGNPAARQRVEFRPLVGEVILSASFGITDFSGFTQVRVVPLTEGTVVVEASLAGGPGRALFELVAIDSSLVRSPASFLIAGGDGQTGQVGTILPQPLTVQALNDDGNPIERLPVVFTATTDGTLLLTAREGDFTKVDSLGNEPTASDSLGRQIVSFTNENGVAAVLARLRTRPGENRIAASATPFGGFSTEVVFTATGELGGTASADSIVKISGDEQDVTFDTTGVGFTPSHTFNPMVVQVTDRFGNPIAGLTVFFRVSNGFGTLSNTTATTDESGFAETVYTSGAGNLGGIAVSASVPGVGSVTFTGSISATGQTPEEEEPPPAPVDSLHQVTPNPVVDPVVEQTFPLVVQAFEDSAPLAGVSVQFILASGAGTLSVTNATTGADGLASTTYTKPAGESSFAVSAVSSIGTVQFIGAPPGGG